MTEVIAFTATEMRAIDMNEAEALDRSNLMLRAIQVDQQEFVRLAMCCDHCNYDPKLIALLTALSRRPGRSSAGCRQAGTDHATVPPPGSPAGLLLATW